MTDTIPPPPTSEEEEAVKRLTALLEIAYQPFDGSKMHGLDYDRRLVKTLREMATLTGLLLSSRQADKAKIERKDQEIAALAMVAVSRHAAVLAAEAQLQALREALEPFAEAARLAIIGGRPPHEFVGASDYDRAAALHQQEQTGRGK